MSWIDFSLALGAGGFSLGVRVSDCKLGLCVLSFKVWCIGTQFFGD